MNVNDMSQEEYDTYLSSRKRPSYKTSESADEKKHSHLQAQGKIDETLNRDIGSLETAARGYYEGLGGNLVENLSAWGLSNLMGVPTSYSDIVEQLRPERESMEAALEAKHPVAYNLGKLGGMVNFYGKGASLIGKGASKLGTPAQKLGEAYEVAKKAAPITTRIMKNTGLGAAGTVVDRWREGEAGLPSTGELAVGGLAGGTIGSAVDTVVPLAGAYVPAAWKYSKDLLKDVGAKVGDVPILGTLKEELKEVIPAAYQNVKGSVADFISRASDAEAYVSQYVVDAAKKLAEIASRGGRGAEVRENIAGKIENIYDRAYEAARPEHINLEEGLSGAQAVAKAYDTRARNTLTESAVQAGRAWGRQQRVTVSDIKKKITDSFTDMFMGETYNAPYTFARQRAKKQAELAMDRLFSSADTLGKGKSQYIPQDVLNSRAINLDKYYDPKSENLAFDHVKAALDSLSGAGATRAASQATYNIGQAGSSLPGVEAWMMGGKGADVLDAIEAQVKDLPEDLQRAYAGDVLQQKIRDQLPKMSALKRAQPAGKIDLPEGQREAIRKYYGASGENLLMDIDRLNAASDIMSAASSQPAKLPPAWTQMLLSSLAKSVNVALSYAIRVRPGFESTQVRSRIARDLLLGDTDSVRNLLNSVSPDKDLSAFTTSILQFVNDLGEQDPKVFEVIANELDPAVSAIGQNLIGADRYERLTSEPESAYPKSYYSGPEPDTYYDDGIIGISY